MLKRLISIAIIISWVLAASMVSANTVSLAYRGVTDAGTPTIWDPAANNNAGGWVTVYAGNYTISYSTAPDIIIKGYCVDPHDTYTKGAYTAYDLQPIVKGSGFEAAAWVLSQGYGATLAAAAQVAVWELVWDWAQNRPFDLASGDSRVQNPTPSFVSEVETIYGAALAGIGPNFDASRYVLAANPVPGGTTNYQDFVVPNPNPTPLPATILLLGSGLLGLVVLRRRKKAAS